MPLAAMLAAFASIDASLCGVFRAFFGCRFELVERNENRLAACRDRRGFRADLNRRNASVSPDAANVNVRRFATVATGTAFAFFDVLAIVPILSPLMPEAWPPPCLPEARERSAERGGYRRAWPGCAASEVDRKGRKSEDDAPPCERAALPSRRR
jgi:hypothetical protein